jgi:hypothetical protein
MGKIKDLMAVLLLTACSSKKVEPATPIITLHDQLQTEIDRIKPNLKWCNGFAVNSICNYGDSHYRTGQLFLLGAFTEQKESAFASYAASIDEDGRPWRGPAKDETPNSYSRDQTLGLVMATLGGIDKSLLQRVYDYAKRSNALCPDATDTRCMMTPSIEVVIRDTLGLSVDKALRNIADAQLITDSHTAKPNYQAALVMQYVMIKANQGQLNSYHSISSEVIKSKIPNNLYAQTVYLVAHNGTPEQFQDVGVKLLACLKTTIGGGIHALWEQGNIECRDDIYGQEVIALAQFLMRKT